mgnify:CR=1 FL=1
MDPFNSATESEPAEVAAPAATTFDAPSAVASALIGAEPEWQQHSCNISVRVPVGGETTIESDTLQKALCAAMGQENISSVVQPTGFTIVGEMSHNPSGVPIGINISNCTRTAVHIGDDGQHQVFSGIMANRFHPVGSSTAPLVGVKVGAEMRSERELIAQKWAGVQMNDLLRGVQQLSAAKIGDEEKPQTQFAVPIAIPTADGETMCQQPLGWCIERNLKHFGEQVKMAAMPTSNGRMVDHFIIGQPAMENILEATSQNVFGAQSLDDVVISAQPLESYSGSDVITVGLKVNADLLNFMKMEE